MVWWKSRPPAKRSRHVAEPPTVLGEAPKAIRSAPDGSRVSELLAVYLKVLDTVDDLPLLPMVLRKHRGRLHYCLRAKWPVRYFVVRHVQRTLASLSRRYCARAALGQRADGEQKDREAVREFEQSLPPDRQKIYFLLLTAAIVVVFRLITPAVVGLLETKPSRSWDIQQLRDISTKIIGAINPSGTSVNEAVNAVLGGGIWDDGALTLGVMVSGYVVLRPLMPAFRLKRMLFNLAPEPERRHRSAVARWSVSQSTGLYDRERRVFAELDSRPPAEFPLDLAVSTVATVVPLTLCGILVRLAIASPELRSQAYTSAAWVLVAVLVRLAWLWRTWRRRELGRSGPFTPYEVRIRAGRAIAKVEYPVGVRQLLFLLFFVSFAFNIYAANRWGRWPNAISVPRVLVGSTILALVLFVLFSLPWWYRINRELRDLERSYDSRSPGWSFGFLFMTPVGWCLVLPPCIAVFKTGKLIQRAQARAGLPVTMRSPWILAPGVFFAPLLFSYLQRELNKIWKAEGQPLDPWPAESSPEVPAQPRHVPPVAGAPNRLTDQPPSL